MDCELPLTLDELTYLEDLLYCRIREGGDERIDMLCDIQQRMRRILDQPVVGVGEPLITEEQWLENLKKEY